MHRPAGAGGLVVIVRINHVRSKHFENPAPLAAGNKFSQRDIDRFPFGSGLEKLHDFIENPVVNVYVGTHGWYPI